MWFRKKQKVVHYECMQLLTCIKLSFLDNNIYFSLIYCYVFDELTKAGMKGSIIVN